MKIEIITTGGTIDGTDSDSGIVGEPSDAAKWLSAQPGVELLHTPLMNKDSRQITDDDRDQIIQAVLNSTADYIMVTHGTFTICHTGRALKRAGQNHKFSKPVILASAWTSFREPHSDAPRQMMFALQSLKDRPAGILIALDNQLWDPDTTEKVETAPGVFRFCTVASERK